MSDDEAKKQVCLALGFAYHKFKSTSKIGDIDFMIGSITKDDYVS